MSPSSVVIVCQPRPSSSELEEVVSRSAVTRSVVVPAAVEDVWAALTDPGRLEDWFADEVEAAGFEPDDEVVFRWHEDDEERRAVIQDVDAPRRLVFRWDARGDDSRVVFALDDDVTGTRVTVVETGLTASGAIWGPRMATLSDGARLLVA